MMKTIRFISLLTLILVTLGSCYNNNDENLYYESGNIKREVFKQKGGNKAEVKYFYENGDLNEHYFMEDGVYEGKYFWYDEKGRLKYERTYHKGMKHGNLQEYYDDGVCEYSATYKSGKMHGVTIKYNSSEEVSQEFLYLNNRQVIYKQHYVDEARTREKISSFIIDSNKVGHFQGKLIINAKNNKIIEEKSFLYQVKSQDTIKVNKTYSVDLHFACDEIFDLELQIGDMDSTLAFTTTPKVYTSSNNDLTFEVTTKELGDYLVLGKLKIKSKEDGEEYEQVFYHQFYVRE